MFRADAQSVENDSGDSEQAGGEFLSDSKKTVETQTYNYASHLTSGCKAVSETGIAAL
jgi:hypothetical protein